MEVTVFIPCFIDACYPDVGVAVVDVLERLGHRVVFDDRLICCGQPPFNAGYWDEARRIARPVVDRLRDAEAVVVPSGSCGAMIKKFYADLFDDTGPLAAKTFEFSEFLVDRLGVTDVGAELNATATFHDGCHGLRELGVKQQPRTLLSHVRGLKLVEMSEAETCCGFGGTFAAKFPMISTAMGEVKCASAVATDADVIVSNDSSCLMQIAGLLNRQGKKIRTMHLAEVLASRASLK